MVWPVTIHQSTTSAARPRLETGDERYLWVNKIIAICSGARTPDAVLLDFCEVR
jgi:hypothetical protein